MQINIYPRNLETVFSVTLVLLRMHLSNCNFLICSIEIQKLFFIISHCQSFRYIM